MTRTQCLPSVPFGKRNSPHHSSLLAAQRCQPGLPGNTSLNPVQNKVLAGVGPCTLYTAATPGSQLLRYDTVDWQNNECDCWEQCRLAPICDAWLLCADGDTSCASRQPLKLDVAGPACTRQEQTGGSGQG